MTNDMASMRDIIIRLKEKKEERGLSLDSIIELIKEDNNGYSPVKSTLSRVFRENSEDERFSYEDVIRPLARVLFDIENIEETDTEDVKTLKLLLKIKMERIEELERQIEKDKLAYLEKMEEERQAWNRSIEFLKEQVSYKDKRMDLLLDAVKEKDIVHSKLLEHILNCPYRGCRQEG